MEKYCKSCGRVFKNSDFKICPYCGSSLSTRQGRQPIPRKLRHQVFQRDGYRCRECGATNKQTRLHVDHIKPVAKGGTNDLRNLQTLCEACNLAKYTDEWVGGSYNNHYTDNSKQYNFKKYPILNGHKYKQEKVTKKSVNDYKEYEFSKLIEDYMDDLCRIYSIPKLGKTYVSDKIRENNTFEDVVDKLKMYARSEQPTELNIKQKKYNSFMNFYDELDDLSVQCLHHHYGVSNRKKIINSLIDEFETVDSVLDFINSYYNFERITFGKGLLTYKCYDGSTISANSLEELEKKAKMMRIIWEP